MTSSFGNLIGKERDEIPGYGIDNYEATEPDLTSQVNAQIDANIQDTRVFYERLGEIQKQIAETPMKNLESLAQFSSTAVQTMNAFKKRQEAQEKINEAVTSTPSILALGGILAMLMGSFLKKDDGSELGKNL